MINTIPLPVPYNKFISINFTNKYLNQENSRVLQINLNISPSSCLGSVEVNEILEEYNSISSNLKRRNYEEWEGRRIKNIDLNYILKFKNNENHLSIHEIIKKSNSFNIIHWATTNLPWFYYDYDIIYCEGLSIKNLIEKYGNDITNDKLKNIIKISEMKAQFFLSYQCPQYDEQDRIDHYEHLQWLKDIKNDWMDNESDYWNID